MGHDVAKPRRRTRWAAPAVVALGGLPPRAHMKRGCRTPPGSPTTPFAWSAAGELQPGRPWCLLNIGAGHYGLPVDLRSGSPERTEPTPLLNHETSDHLLSLVDSQVRPGPQEQCVAWGGVKQGLFLCRVWPNIARRSGGGALGDRAVVGSLGRACLSQEYVAPAEAGASPWRPRRAPHEGASLRWHDVLDERARRAVARAVASSTCRRRLPSLDRLSPGSPRSRGRSRPRPGRRGAGGRPVRR